jgi:glycosyltransferase involved in cell wall biosynthesis
VIYTVIGAAVVLGPIAARLAGAKVVTGVRGTPQNMARWKWVLCLSDRVIALSNEMKDVIVQAFTEKFHSPIGNKTTVIYNGVDLKKGREPSVTLTDRRAQLGFGTGDFLILYPAAFRAWKGHLGFIRNVLPSVFEDETVATKAQVVFVGSSGNHEEEVYEQECKTASNRARFSSRIHFAGFQANVWPWYGSSDIVVLASENLEGMPRIIIEAMCCGKPVVSYDVCSARELLERSGAGFVIPQGDSKAMAQAIIDLARDQSRREEMGVRGKNFAMKHLDITAIAKAYERVFADLT